MIHLVIIKPKKGMRYVAAITRDRALAQAHCQRSKEPSELKPVRLRYPFHIVEKNNRFYVQKDDTPKKGLCIVYRIESDWYPREVLADEMGTLDHRHHGE
jgi:hypothetical protein